MAKQKAHRTKKYTVTLSECELRRLSAYASIAGVSRPVALARIMRQGLREVVSGFSQLYEISPNQLGLFDAVQIDIFNNQKKVEKQDV